MGNSNVILRLSNFALEYKPDKTYLQTSCLRKLLVIYQPRVGRL